MFTIPLKLRRHASPIYNSFSAFSIRASRNTFVQNVFVGTQDLRFPWIGVFALSYICAGTELTWDYAYEVGSVPEKEIKCQCGSNECRGRLL